MTILFGQAIIGAPGAGKSSYCREMSEHLARIGRNTLTINLDPGNETDAEWSIDVRELIKTEEIMDSTGLGPNGALLYAMEYIDTNWKWIEDRIKPEMKKADNSSKPGPYLLFDFPGQIELFTSAESVRNIVKKLEKSGHRIVVVQLIDSLYCTDPAKFISAVLTSLSAMIRLEMPHINLLSKIDAIKEFGAMPFGLEYFTEVMDLRWMIDQMSEDPFLKEFRALSQGISQVIADYSLVSFIPFSIHEKETLEKVLVAADKGNGHFMGSDERTIRSMLECAMTESDRESTLQFLKEKYGI